MAKDSPTGAAQPSTTNPWGTSRAPSAMQAMPPQNSMHGMNAQMPGTVEGNVGGAPVMPAGMPATGAVPPAMPSRQPMPQSMNAMRPGTVEANVGAMSRTPVMQGRLPPAAVQPAPARGPMPPQAGLPAARPPAPMPVGNAAPQGMGVMAPQPFGLMQPSAAPPNVMHGAAPPPGMPPVPPGSMAPRMQPPATGGMNALPPGVAGVPAMAQRGAPVPPRSFNHWQQPNRAFTR
jgi:hypothetical protein